MAFKISLLQNSKRTITQKKSMSKFANDNISKKIYLLIFIFSPGNLLIIFYKMAQFEAPTCKIVFLKYPYYTFSMSTFAKGITQKNKISFVFIFTSISTHHLLSADKAVIFVKIPSLQVFNVGNNSKKDISTYFYILPGKLLIIFYKLDKFDLLAVIIFEISPLQFSNVKMCIGR